MENDSTAWTSEEGPRALSEQTLEEVLRRGETPHGKKQDAERMSLHSYPAIL